MHMRIATLALVLLAMTTAGAARTLTPHVLTTLSREAVAVGETFALEVEALVGADGDEAALVRGLGAPLPEVRGIEVVRDEGVRVTTLEGARLLTRRLLLRALTEGALTMPGLSLTLDGATVHTEPYRIVAYRPTSDFYEATRAVLPVAAEGDGFVRLGSAFLVEEDALVTAYHVVVGADRVRVHLPNGRRVTVKEVWAVDPVRDVAVLRVDPRAVRRAGLSPLTLAPSRSNTSGVALTAGWAGGAQRTAAGVRYPDLDLGAGEATLVSSNRVEPGDSGGPLLDPQGRVLGVVTSGRAAPTGHDVLPEDVCLAADARPALAARLRARAPRALRRALAEAEAAVPHAAAFGAVSALSLRARQDQRADRLDALRLVATEAPADAPAAAALHFLLGSALDAAGDSERAARAFRAALDAHPDYFPAAYALGHHHLRQEQLGAAERYFRRAQGHPAYARLAALALARSYAAGLRYAEAEGELRTVLHREARFAPALYLLALCRQARGWPEEAAALAARLEPLDAGWAERVRLHLREPVLQPTVLAALPPVHPVQR